MASRLRLILLFASVAVAISAFSDHEYQRKMEYISNTTAEIFRKYATRSQESYQLKALEQFQRPNGTGFCYTTGNCCDDYGYEAPIKVITCDQWDVHVIPKFIRRNDISQVRREGRFVRVSENSIRDEWTLLQVEPSLKQMKCTATSSFTNDHGEPILNSIDFHCPMCDFYSIPLPRAPEVQENVKQTIRAIQSDLQTYATQGNNVVGINALKHFENVILFITVVNANIYLFPATKQDEGGPTYVDHEVKCFNSTSGTPFRPRTIQSGLLDKMMIAQFLLSQKVVRIIPSENYSTVVNFWNEFDGLYKVRTQWTLVQKDTQRKMEKCTAFTEFNRASEADDLYLEKFTLDCEGDNCFN